MEMLYMHLADNCIAHFLIEITIFMNLLHSKVIIFCVVNISTPPNTIYLYIRETRFWEGTNSVNCCMSLAIVLKGFPGLLAKGGHTPAKWFTHLQLNFLEGVAHGCGWGAVVRSKVEQLYWFRVRKLLVMLTHVQNNTISGCPGKDDHQSQPVSCPLIL